MLNSAFNWPPNYVDELAALLRKVRDKHPAVARQTDTEYMLTTALSEIEDWLEVLPRGQRDARRQSMLQDIEQAFSTRGQEVRSQTPTAELVLHELQALRQQITRSDANNAIKQLEALRTELAHPDTVVAAFQDVVTAVQNTDSSPQQIEARLEVLKCVLELADRPVIRVCQVIGEIVDDQALEIDLAHHDLDGTDLPRRDQPDEQAGLPVEDRMHLAHRYLQHPAQIGHHVVWFVYKNARLPGPKWRLRVGPVEFCDGPTLVEAIANVGTNLMTPLPDELTKRPAEGGIADGTTWPKVDELRWWIAARVDLENGQFSDPVRVASEQVEAVVQLAKFPQPEKPTWEPLSGHIHLIDGVERSRRGPFYERVSIDQMWAEHDRTAGELGRLATTAGPHLPVVSTQLRRILEVVTTLNISAKSADPDLLMHDIRAIHWIRMECEEPDWAKFLKDNNAIVYAYNRVLNDVYDAVSDVLHDPTLLIPGSSELRAEIYYHDKQMNGMVLDRAAALDLVPQLVSIAADHNMAVRRLREVARRTESLREVRAWVQDLLAEYRGKIARVARLRNALAHDGAVQPEVARTVKHFINQEVRMIAWLALKAILENQPVRETFAERRGANKAWLKAIDSASSIRDALLWSPNEDQ
jgi:hypothetical protein